VLGALGLAGFSHSFDGRLDGLIPRVEAAATAISAAGRRPRSREEDAMEVVV